MATHTKLVEALLRLEKETPDKRKVYVRKSDSVKLRRIVRVVEEGDSVVIVTE